MKTDRLSISIPSNPLDGWRTYLYTSVSSRSCRIGCQVGVRGHRSTDIRLTIEVNEWPEKWTGGWDGCDGVKGALLLRTWLVIHCKIKTFLISL